MLNLCLLIRHCLIHSGMQLCRLIRKPRGCKWVFCVKENRDGSVIKLRARLLAKGFHDFNETLYPVVKHVTIHIILTLVLTQMEHSKN